MDEGSEHNGGIAMARVGAAAAAAAAAAEGKKVVGWLRGSIFWRWIRR